MKFSITASIRTAGMFPTVSVRDYTEGMDPGSRVQMTLWCPDGTPLHLYGESREQIAGWLTALAAHAVEREQAGAAA